MNAYIFTEKLFSNFMSLNVFKLLSILLNAQLTTFFNTLTNPCTHFRSKCFRIFSKLVIPLDNINSFLNFKSHHFYTITTYNWLKVKGKHFPIVWKQVSTCLYTILIQNSFSEKCNAFIWDLKKFIVAFFLPPCTRKF